MQLDIQVSNKQLLGLVFALVLIAAIGYARSYGSGSPTVVGHTWDELDGIPADLADGDNDMFAGISCGEGQILKISGGGWMCVDDPSLLPECSSGEHLEWTGSEWGCTNNVVTISYADSNYKDSPGQWTCTVRSASGGDGLTTVNCVGNEKVITGGCRTSKSYTQYLTSYPITHGWQCQCTGSSSLCGTIRAYAYCCE